MAHPDWNQQSPEWDGELVDPSAGRVFLVNLKALNPPASAFGPKQSVDSFRDRRDKLELDTGATLRTGNTFNPNPIRRRFALPSAIVSPQASTREPTETNALQ